MTEERFLSSACKIEFLPNKGWPPIAPLRDGYAASYGFASGKDALKWLATCSAGQRGCAWAYGIGWSIDPEILGTWVRRQHSFGRRATARLRAALPERFGLTRPPDRHP
jgi:hypothetical protein